MWLTCYLNFFHLGMHMVVHLFLIWRLSIGDLCFPKRYSYYLSPYSALPSYCMRSSLKSIDFEDFTWNKINCPDYFRIGSNCYFYFYLFFVIISIVECFWDPCSKKTIENINLLQLIIHYSWENEHKWVLKKTLKVLRTFGKVNN